MKPPRPKNLREYKKWLKESHKIEITSRTEEHYTAVTLKALTDFKKSDFWKTLSAEVERINQEYYRKTNYYLIGEKKTADLLIKPFSSFFDKTFRKNVVKNRNWPAQPEGGWVLPETWFSQVNDTIRTYFVVKYLDGVSFFAEKCAELADGYSLERRIDFEAKEEGYYAAHFYVVFPCEVPRHNWDTKREDFSVEIQITTQLQEVIKILLHKYYEQRRAKQKTTQQAWQWDFKSDEFATNYLGHILHYVEGMIMDVRDNRVGKEPKDES